jgi:hypothetical protein
MRTILALDPGVTTGFCVGTHVKDKLYVSPNEGQFSLGEIETLMRNFLGLSANLNVVYEDFSYRNVARMGLDLTPVKVIGIIELFEEKFEPFVPFHKQSAATAKGFFTDAKLKNMGIYKVGVQHGRDATRHLLHWANFGPGGGYIDLLTVAVEMVEIDWLLDEFYHSRKLLP